MTREKIDTYIMQSISKLYFKLLDESIAREPSKKVALLMLETRKDIMKMIDLYVRDQH